MLQALPIALFLFYFVLTSTSYRILATFLCDEFVSHDLKGESNFYLHDDYALECGRSSAYQRAKAWAYVLIALWPIGVPACFTILLMKSAKAIQHQEPTTLMRATHFVSAALLSVVLTNRVPSAPTPPPV